MVFNDHHADYLVWLFSENLSNDELATRLSKQFGVRITGGAGRYAADQDAPTYRCYLSRLPVSQSGQSLQRLSRSYPPAAVDNDSLETKANLAAELSPRRSQKHRILPQ
jgi:hypothetical protein